MRINRWLAIVLLLVAWLLLQFRLDSIPPGFQHDQTYDSRNALQVVGGQFPIYFPDNFGLDPGFMYAAAAVFRLTGGHYVWGLRFTATIFAMLGLAVSFAFARRYLRPRPALFAVALTAGSFGFLFAGRLGLEPIALLPTAVVYFYFLLVAEERPRLRTYVVAGVLGGVAIYTYLASRTLFALPVLLLCYEVAIFAWAWSRRRPAVPGTRTRIAGLLTSLFTMALVSAPLLFYLFTHVTGADQRIGELDGPVLSALRGNLLPLAQSFLETARALLWDGTSRLPFHYNLPGRAVLQPLWAACFVIGLMISLVQLHKRKEFFLLVVLLLGLGPTLLTSPDAIFMRSIYALPLLFIIAVRGAVAVVAFMQGRARKYGFSLGGERRAVAASVLTTIAVTALLVAHFTDNAKAYFREWAEDERVQRIYNGDFRLAAGFLDKNAGQEEIFIGSDRSLALDILTYDLYEPRRQDVSWFRLPGNPPLPAGDDGVYLGPTTAAIPPMLEMLVGAGARQDLLRDTLEQPLMWVIRVTPEVLARVAEDAKLRAVEPPVTYESTLRLDGVGWQDRGNEGTLLTRWTALGRWPRSSDPGLPLLQPKVDLSLTDSSGYRWASVHAPVMLPVHTAQPGMPLMETTTLPLPPDMPPGSYSVNLVLYDDKAGPLAMSQGSGAFRRTPIPIAALDVPLRPFAETPAAPLGVGASEVGPLQAKGKWEEWTKLLAGVPTDVHVSWQAKEDLETAGLAFRVAAYDQSRNLLWQQIEPAPDLGRKWEAGRTFRLTHTVKPEEGAPGTTAVRLSICAEREGRGLGMRGRRSGRGRQPASRHGPCPTAQVSC